MRTDIIRSDVHFVPTLRRWTGFLMQKHAETENGRRTRRQDASMDGRNFAVCQEALQSQWLTSSTSASRTGKPGVANAEGLQDCRKLLPWLGSRQMGNGYPLEEWRVRGCVVGQEPCSP